jgi:hypothetical protein
LVAQALDEPTTPSVTNSAPFTLRAARTATTPSTISDLGRDLEPVLSAPDESDASPVSPAVGEPDASLVRAITVLTATYSLDERGPRIVELQQLLGVTADGWYGNVTNRVHVAALEGADLPTDGAPTIIVPVGPTAGEWAALRECEAGGDYSITNPSGKYRGAYQFDRSTWNSVAERHDPALVGVDPAAASPAEQDAMALALYTERGARPWPHCGRHLS